MLIETAQPSTLKISEQIALNNKSKSENVKLYFDKTKLLPKDILDEFLPSLGENDKFNQYYEELNGRILKNFKGEMDKTKNVLFRVMPTSRGIANIKKMELEKEQENAIQYRQMIFQERLQNHFRMHK